MLEGSRRSHEERERLIDTMVRESLHDKKTVPFPFLLLFAPSHGAPWLQNKEKINSEHRLKMLLDVRHSPLCSCSGLDYCSATWTLPGNF